MSIGTAAAYIAIILTAYQFKRIVLEVIANPTDEVISKAMSFRCNGVVAFTVTLLVNTLFIQFSLAIILFLVFWIISILQYFHIFETLLRKYWR